MARIAGMRGRLYVGIASSTADPSPVAFINKMDINFASDRYDVTALGDANKAYVQGLEDVSGTYAGFYDTATAQLYTAASDGDPRKFYFYPDARVGTTGPYWFGSAFFDTSISIPVDGPATISGNFAASGDVSKQG